MFSLANNHHSEGAPQCEAADLLVLMVSEGDEVETAEDQNTCFLLKLAGD